MNIEFTKYQENKIAKGVCIIPGCNVAARTSRHVCTRHTHKMHRFRRAYEHVYPIYVRLCSRNGLIPLEFRNFQNQHNKIKNLYPPYL